MILADLAPFTEHEPDEQVRILRAELAAHRPELLERPIVVVGSRADMVEAHARADQASYGGSFVISAVTREGLDELVRHLFGVVDAARATQGEIDTAPVVHRPQPEGVQVTQTPEGFVVEGRDAVGPSVCPISPTKRRWHWCNDA